MNPEQANSWTYQNIRDATQLAMDSLMMSVGGKLLQVATPAIKYAWANKPALKAALGSEALGKDFLAKCGLLNPVTNELKFSAKDLVDLSISRSTCLHDAMIALNKKTKRGYADCIKAYFDRKEVRKFCVEKGFSAAKTAEIMAHKNLAMEVHHIFSPKNVKDGFSRKFNRIVKRYNLDLEGSWNKIKIPHKGRHPRVYHRWSFQQLEAIDAIANGDKQIFLDLVDTRLKQPIIEDPLRVRGIRL